MSARTYQVALRYTDGRKLFFPLKAMDEDLPTVRRMIEREAAHNSPAVQTILLRLVS